MSNNKRLWVPTSLNTDCCLLILSASVHGYIRVGGISTLKMEVVFSLITRQKSTRLHGIAHRRQQSSLTKPCSEGIRRQTAENIE